MTQESWLPRPQYTRRIAPFANGELIKVLLYQRRVGKSGLLRLLEADWRASHPGLPVLFLDKEQDEWRSLRTGSDLIDAARAARPPEGFRSLLAVDEVQEIDEFAPALRSLAASGLRDIYITGQ